MKKFCLLLFFTPILILGKAQNSEDSVKMIVNQLFTAMKNSDSTLLENCFADSAVLQTIVEKDGKVEINDVRARMIVGIDDRLAESPDTIVARGCHVKYTGTRVCGNGA